MADRKDDRKQIFYTCGWCKTSIFYKKTEQKPKPCPECGWWHADEHQYDDVPSEIKMDLNDPTIT